MHGACIAKKQIFRKLFSDNADKFLAFCLAFKLDSSVYKCKECIVAADTYTCAGMNICTSLANDNVACENALTIRLLDAESLRTAVSAVLGRTNAFFVGEEL